MIAAIEKTTCRNVFFLSQFVYFAEVLKDTIMITLDIPLMAWCTVAVIMLTLILLRVIPAISRHRKALEYSRNAQLTRIRPTETAAPKLKFFEIGSESEELFLPGDKDVTKSDFSDEYAD